MMNRTTVKLDNMKYTLGISYIYYLIQYRYLIISLKQGIIQASTAYCHQRNYWKLRSPYWKDRTGQTGHAGEVERSRVEGIASLITGALIGCLTSKYT